MLKLGYYVTRKQNLKIETLALKLEAVVKTIYLYLVLIRSYLCRIPSYT